LDAETAKTLEKLQKGDASDFSKLVDAFNPMIKAVARSYLNSGSDVEDVVSEVWMKVYENIHLLRDIQSFPGWIRKILRNQCLNEIKRSKRENKQVCLEGYRLKHPLISSHLSRDFQRFFEIQSAKSVVDHVMGSLHEIYAIPLNLHYLEGMPIQQICEVLSLPVSTVKWRLFQGRALFRKKAVTFINGKKKEIRYGQKNHR
jgi:RNA polymerase sigma-70 factor, ECF subfamily